MAICGPARTTPLIRFAKSLDQADVDEEECTSFFPMYVLPVNTFLQMDKVKTHEELRADGSIVEFVASMGQTAFVSHQWVRHDHPDPEFCQLRVLRNLLGAWMAKPTYISPDFATVALLPFAKGVSSKELFSRPLHLWYDFFCCPQMSDAGEELAKAIDSIPAYVARSRFFFVLFPVVRSSEENKIISPATWAARGWCRLERTMRALSLNPSYIVIKSEFCVEVVACQIAAFGGGPPGEGMFTIPADRSKLAPVLRGAVTRSLMLSLRALDLVRYRILLNLQNFFLRGLSVEPVADLVPAFEPLPGADATSYLVAKFLYQNGFTKVRSVDASGCSPLCYAAMNGDPELIDALLAHQADPNDFVRRVSSKGGFPMLMSVASMCASLGNNDAMCRLMAARADVGGAFPAICSAADSDNAKGVHILCQCNSPDIRDVYGMSALDHACASGSVAAVEQLLIHTRPTG
ncbi:B'ETA [Symbiodinium sp. CCMP2456]|nr:B'ETA [Symbiodinium sp. CCMP2456]